MNPINHASELSLVVPVESKLSLEEQKVLKEANGKRVDTPKAVMPKEEKKKKGFFKRLFGKKDKN